MSRTATSRRQRWRMEMQGWLIEQVVMPGRRWTMLDLGTEYGHSAEHIKKRWPDADIVGVEVHEPTLDACLEDRGYCYSGLVLADAVKHLETCEPVDIVLAAEIIEHMTPEDGVTLIRLAAQKARKLAIITTPIGFQPHGPIDGNPHQEHISGWDRHDFEACGWRTFVQMPYGYGLGVYFLDKTGLL